MGKYIHITKENREGLMGIFGVTQRTVFNAVNYCDGEPENPLLARIRKAALERGGVMMTDLPAVETLHDADGYMRQYLPGGVLLEFDKRTGGCDVIRKGECVRHYDNVAVNGIPAIQQWAAGLN